MVQWAIAAYYKRVNAAVGGLGCIQDGEWQVCLQLVAAVEALAYWQPGFSKLVL